MRPRTWVRLQSRSESSGQQMSTTIEEMENPVYGTTAVDANSFEPYVKRQLQRLKSTERVTYTWKDVNVWTGPPPGSKDDEKCGGWFSRKRAPSRQLLKNVSGIIRPGELVAIMGASGAGKTTLLNVLNHRNTSGLKISGQRCLNGVRVGPDTLTSMSAYIQQDDLFIGTLTVREHLTFQARVRMDSDIPYKVRMNRVDEVIQELGLSKCENTTIGYPGRIKGISGGEMKRLAFASEVLTDPPLMFCDEPTSGLDSYMAENIVTALRELSARGKTIICTIHQPSSQVYALFDRVLLMAEGRVAFMGNTDVALPFFEHCGFICPPQFNPSDFYIQTLAIQPGKESDCKETVHRICDEFAESATGREIQAAVDSMHPEKESEEYFKLASQAKQRHKSPYKISWLRQFSAVLWRSWINYIKDPFVLRIRIIQSIFMSLLVGAIYFGQEANQDGVQNMNGALFVILTNTTFQTTFGVIDVFCLELPIFLREHFNGMYRTDVYFLAKVLAELPLYIFLPIIAISINYFMIGFNPDWQSFLKVMAVLVLINNFGVSMGYMLSCMSSSMSIALALGPAILMPSMLFSGMLMNAGSVPKWLIWLKYSSIFYYGNEALAIAQWKSIDKITCNRNNATCPPSGAVVLQALDYDPDNFDRDIYLMIGLIAVALSIAFLSLLAKTRRK